MIDHRTDLLNYVYFMLLEICKQDTQFKRLGQKIQVVNLYDK